MSLRSDEPFMEKVAKDAKKRELRFQILLCEGRLSRLRKEYEDISMESDKVRFTLLLPPDAYDALERLRQLSGKQTLEETVIAALKLYGVAKDGDKLYVEKKV